MEAASGCIRSALNASEGKKLIATDLSNIEGRFAAWLAGEEWKLRAFRAFDRGEGPDLYYVGASEVLGIPIEAVTKDQRQSHGKTPELACQFQGAVGAFQSMARIFGMEISDARALEIVKAWRKKNKNIVDLWYELERQAIRAVEQPGLRLEAANGRLVLQRDGSWLRIKLPSGRCLCYPGVAVEDGKLTYMGENQYSRRWERINTYGGKLFENCVQAGSRDVMAHNMIEAEDAGYEIVLTCHDELVCEVPDEDGWTTKRLSEILSSVPPWATGLPLAASGWEGQRYRK
jgi:DNA polymerase